MFWTLSSGYSWLETLAIKTVKAGPIPKHVAFIMDGNRRFARKNNISNIESYKQGVNTITNVKRWCLDTGIQEITIYALSTENLKRSPEQVQVLLDLFKDNFQQLLDNMSEIMADGVCIKIIGDLSVVDSELKNLIARVVCATKDNKILTLNIAFAYTSRQEIKMAIADIKEGVEKNMIDENDVTEQLISECLYTNSDPDVLIRTSGEVRFSDFMLWQTSTSVVLFTDTLWPDFGIWRIIALIFYYQRHYTHLQEMKQVKMAQDVNYTRSKSPKAQEFLNKLHQKRMNILQSYIID